MGQNQKEDSKELTIEQVIEGLNLLKEDLIKEINSRFDSFQSQYKRIDSKMISLLTQSKNSICNQLFNELDNLEKNLKNDKKSQPQDSIRQNKNIRYHYKNKVNYNNKIQNRKDAQVNFRNDTNQIVYKNVQIPNNINLYESEVITSKDIQIENKNITIKLQKKALKQINDNDDIPNKTVALFLKDVANISRLAYVQSKGLKNSMFDLFQKTIMKKNNISFSYYLKPFSAWIKYLEKNNKEVYNELKKIKVDISNKNKDIVEYFRDLFCNLTILYFHCQISFPIVEIDFNPKSKDFDYGTMIDILNYGKGKIHFSFLPSLYSNENYLENSKLWVYTINQTSYQFSNNIINQLNEIINRK